MYSLELNSLLDRKFIMGNRFLDRVKDNAAVRTWAEMTHGEKDSSRQNLFESGKCTELLEEADEYNED
ncbi:hypothetical protein Goari_026898, partial [Gossypium aridum]|nr:hypothetical protein [Gossypium aridum]